MNTRVRCSALVVAVLSMFLASGIRAQLRVELGATIGSYSPLRSFQPASVYSTALPGSPSSLGGTAFGGQIRLWVSPRLGFELAGATTSSTFGGGFTPGGEVPRSSARVTTGTAQLLVLVTDDGSRARVWVGAGGGAIQHGGAAYASFGKPVNYGGALGLGSAIRIAGALSADVGVTSLIYNLNIRGTEATDPGLSERGTQADLLLRAGLSYSIH
ncbi:MAG TPA: hypothetical protein VK511_11910 [Gemmatimonadaceae bacterium]|nr:hypothetical protein [Gemmatimonadaceae bacterium]